MKQIIGLFTVVITGFILFSCRTGNTSKAHSSGKTAEIVIVTKDKDEWNDKAGMAIRDYFNQDYGVLPQSEPIFEVANVLLESFNNTSMFQAHHSIFIVEIDKNKLKPEIEIRKNVWAIPQRVILLSASSADELVNFFNIQKGIISKVFTDCEHERIVNFFYEFKNEAVAASLKKDFNINLEIPEGFYIAKESADFIWIRKETDKFSQGLMLYKYDYVDTAAFSVSRIISFRNVMTEEFVPGPTDGSFMKVSEEYMPVTSKKIDFNGLFAVETRGLWDLKNDFMGGPFINYTFVDEKRNKVITADGYIYAPNAKKRDLLMQMEAIIYTIKFVE
jgi:hypothetical protein